MRKRSWGMLVDTHCHLDLEPLAGSVDEALERARAAGVRHCVTIGTTVEASRAGVALAHRHAMLRAAVGVHPHEAETVTEEALGAIETLSMDPAVAAIGEVGLDFHRPHASAEAQRRAFLAFLAMARRRGLPLIIHCRDAYEALLDVLRREAGGAVIGVLHCASGPPSFIRESLQLGLHVSFAGNVTFPNAAALRELVPLVPDDRLLLETDAPFLAPQPVRGRHNEPAYVAHTADFLAKLRNMTIESLGALTSGNARRLFGLREDDRLA